MKRALFIGRFQPLHLGHIWLFKQKLEKGIPIWVAIRNIQPDENNPFAPEETKQMVEVALKGEDALVTVIPDIESVNWGRGVGYETNMFTPPESIGSISATEIRRQISQGEEGWKKMVDKRIWEHIKYYLTKH